MKILTWGDWKSFMNTIKILTVLAICFSLSVWAFTAELKASSSEGTWIITGPTKNWVRQFELPKDRDTSKGGAWRITTNRKQCNGTEASGAIDPRFKNNSPTNKQPYAVRPANGNHRSFQSTSGHDKKELIDFAKTYLGSPYKLGGNNTAGIDCSGFVKQVFAAFAIELPRTARTQFATGTRINKEELTAGDLIFFGRGRSGEPSHVGIFMEGDKFIHASVRNGRVVRVDSLEDNYYKHTFMGASRVLR